MIEPDEHEVIYTNEHDTDHNIVQCVRCETLSIVGPGQKWHHTCDGDGRIDEIGRVQQSGEDCQLCEGRGWNYNNPNAHEEGSTSCNNCRATGKIP